MSKPTQSYDWATNTNYAGGPDVGTVTKVEPPAATEQDGWRGNQAPPPQYQNYWQNAVQLHLDYLSGIVDLMQASNWTAARDIAAAAEDLFAIAYDESTGTIIATGASIDTSTLISRDGGEFYALPGTTVPAAALTDGNDIAADGAGAWVIAGQNGSISHSSDDGETWATVAVVDGQANFAIKYDPIASLWVLGKGTPGRIFTSPDRTTWTQRLSSGAAWNDLEINAAGFGIALDANGNYAYSSDLLTWTVVAIPGSGAGHSLDAVAYSEASGVWVIVGEDSAGDLEAWSSTDGITFTAIAGTNIPNDLLLDELAVDSRGTFVLGFGTNHEEVWASTDDGVTWTQAAGFAAGMPRGPIDSRDASGAGQDKLNLEYFAGRFWTAERSGSVWRTTALL